MPHAKKRTPRVEEVRSYVQGVAKNLVAKLYGPDGPTWGTPLTDIEDLLLDVRQILTEEMLAQGLARQAAALDRAPHVARCCPTCQQPLACDGRNERILQTRAGEAQWAEPEGYCRRCRRSFFPSSAGPRH